jgi:hypothetical protein
MFVVFQNWCICCKGLNFIKFGAVSDLGGL